VAKGGIERLTGQGGHDLDRAEPHRPNRLLAGRHDAPTDAPARPVRMNKKRAHARRLAPRVKLRVGVSSVAVAPVERPAFAPAAAAEDLRIPFDHEVSAVPNKLAV